MLEWWTELNQQYPNLKYYISVGLIPFISGGIGWFTNMVALKMTFYPLKFWGLPKMGPVPQIIGWQGIIPRKAHKMAMVATDMLTTRLLPLDELYSRLDPDQMGNEVSHMVDEISDDVVEHLGTHWNEELWIQTPEFVKEQLRQQVRAESPGLMKKVFHGFKTRIMDILSIRDLIIKNLTGKNVGKMVDLFQRVGKPEFRFIELSGLYFGFLFGICQMGLFLVMSDGWTLPVAGVIVGYATNWLALKMIFRPQYPTRYGPIRYHGLFHKRQKEVSAEYAKFVARDILSGRNITHELISPNTRSHFMDIIKEQVHARLNKLSDTLRFMINLSIGRFQFLNLASRAAEKLHEHTPRTVKELENYIEKTLDIENSIYQNLSNLPPEEYEVVLRSAFEEEELILILVGAALGAAAGFAQWMIFFS